MLKLSHPLVALAAVSVVLGAAPAVAQDSPLSPNGHVATFGVEATRAPAAFGIDATTPSRIAASRREMNRGRLGGDRGFRDDMNEDETREYADRVLRRGGFVCEVIDAAVVARSNRFAPFVEVNCSEGGGLVVADTNPIQWVDCLDIPAEGYLISHNNNLNRCALPGNVAAVPPGNQGDSDNN